MKYIIQNEATKQQTIEIERNLWVGGVKVRVDGIAAKKVGKKEFTYQDLDGQSTYIKISGSEFSKIDVKVGAHTHTIVRQLEVYEYIFAFLPAFMIFIGGAIGGGLAGLAIFGLLLLMRTIKYAILKILVSVVLTCLVYVLWAVLANEIMKFF